MFNCYCDLLCATGVADVAFIAQCRSVLDFHMKFCVLKLE
jgi:hypothetical protein